MGGTSLCSLPFAWASWAWLSLARGAGYCCTTSCSMSSHSSARGASCTAAAFPGMSVNTAQAAAFAALVPHTPIRPIDRSIDLSVRSDLSFGELQKHSRRGWNRVPLCKPKTDFPDYLAKFGFERGDTAPPLPPSPLHALRVQHCGWQSGRRLGAGMKTGAQGQKAMGLAWPSEIE